MSEALDRLDVHRLLSQACRAAGSQRAFAEKCGVSPAFLSQVLNGTRSATDVMLRQVGVRRVVSYVEVSR